MNMQSYRRKHETNRGIAINKITNINTSSRIPPPMIIYVNKLLLSAVGLFVVLSSVVLLIGFPVVACAGVVPGI